MKGTIEGLPVVARLDLPQAPVWITRRGVDEYNEGSVAAWANGRVVGRFTFGYPANRREQPYDVVAGQLEVDEQWRGLGIGSALLRAFLDWADGRAVYAEYSAAGMAMCRAVLERGDERVKTMRGFK